MIEGTIHAEDLRWVETFRVETPERLLWLAHTW